MMKPGRKPTAEPSAIATTLPDDAASGRRWFCSLTAAHRNQSWALRSTVLAYVFVADTAAGLLTDPAL